MNSFEKVEVTLSREDFINRTLDKREQRVFSDIKKKAVEILSL